MGIEPGGESVEIKDPEIKGSLSAQIIDSKKTFDDFVKKASEKSGAAKKLLDNKLYQQLSTTLSGSQEFTALEKLYVAYESQNYDLIVLDTPPTKHAIDFLNAPQKIAALFNESIAKWFRNHNASSGFLKDLFQTGTKQVFKLLESLTGSEFIRELADFFNSFEGWSERLEKRTTEVHRLLVRPETSFVLVTSLDEAKMKEADYFAREIRKGGYNLKSLFVNRAVTEADLILNVKYKESDLNESEKKVLKAYSTWVHYCQNRVKSFNFLKKSLLSDYEVIQVPEFEENISDREGVKILAKLLETL
jgi:anion-transporting  ArsA/GET3 family ATPase